VPSISGRAPPKRESAWRTSNLSRGSLSLFPTHVELWRFCLAVKLRLRLVSEMQFTQAQRQPKRDNLVARRHLALLLLPLPKSWWGRECLAETHAARPKGCSSPKKCSMIRLVRAGTNQGSVSGRWLFFRGARDHAAAE
jgi:hypothetical protein